VPFPGRAVRLPNFGMETVHHVHASDVTGVFLTANNRWFGTEPALEFLTLEEWTKAVTEQKARSVLGFAPRYSSLDAVQEAVTFLRARDYRL
jgi:nucleoside-diphosphate-sugar epimerase